MTIFKTPKFLHFQASLGTQNANLQIRHVSLFTVANLLKSVFSKILRGKELEKRRNISPYLFDKNLVFSMQC